MLISNQNEIVLANKILEDTTTYKKLENDETNNVINLINTELNQLKDNDLISNVLFKKLIITNDDNCKCGTLKVMPKIHKKKFEIRQIISNINRPTSKLCEAVDLILNSFIQSIINQKKVF